MDADKMRAKFEAWCLFTQPDGAGCSLEHLLRKGGGYNFLDVHDGWVTWQAAYAAGAGALLEKAEAICHAKGDLCTDNTACYERPEMVKVWASAAGAFYEAAGKIRALLEDS